MADLTCPNCHSPMRSYERNAVTIDQCTGCRGVFLDRGELERLVDAESAYYERERSPERPPERPPERRERDDDDWRRAPSPGYGYGHGHHGHHKRRKKSFLDDIFDFG
jgi:Zn-finger nucleic acid-binding protein